MNDSTALGNPGKLDRVVVAALDAGIALLLAGLLAFTVLAFGAVDAWSERVAVELGGGIAVALGLRLLARPREGLPRTAAHVPLVLFAGLAAAQLVPLPAAVVGFASPQTLAIRRELLGDLPGAADALQNVTLSFYPLATRHDLRLVLLAAVVFLAVRVVFRSPRRILGLLAAVAAMGGGLAALALAQDLTHAEGIYGRYPVPLGTQLSGTFVNHSDFGQHVNLCVGAALGLLLALLAAPAGASAARRAARRVAVALLALVIAADVVALFLSQTRGGAAAAAAGGLLALLTLAFRRGFRALASVVVLLACLALAGLLFAGVDRTYERVRTLGDSEEYASRLTIVGDVLGIARKFPLFGTGLGTHEEFFPRYNTTDATKRFTHAEDEYAQALEETGLAGLACALAFAAVVWRGWGRSVARPDRPECAAAVGLGFGLLAVQVHSFSDFGQHLPAIACLSAVTCALLLNLGSAAPEPRAAAAAGRRFRPGSLAIVALLGVATAWAVPDARRAALAAGRWNSARAVGRFLADQPWAGTETAYASLLLQAREAVILEPDDVHGQLWFNVYRWQALGALPDDTVGPSSTATRGGPDPSRVAQIVDALSAARALCPTFGPLYAFLGALEREALNRPIAAVHLRRAGMLAPHDRVALYHASRASAREGLWEEARQASARSLRFFGDADVLTLYLGDLGRPDLAMLVAPQDYHWQFSIMRAVDDRSAAAAARRRASALLKDLCDGPAPQLEDLLQWAALCAQDGRDEEAAELYRRALAQQYGAVDWRLARAQSLLRLKRFEEAGAEAATCLRLRPDLPAARDLLLQATGRAPAP